MPSGERRELGATRGTGAADAPVSETEAGLTILVVEDNPADSRILEAYLRSGALGEVAIRSSATWSEAKRELAAAPVDAVLLDLTLPDSRGFDTYAALEEAAPGAAILVVTALDDEELARRTLQHGAQDYIVKERLDREGLARAVRYAIERRRLLAELERRNASMVVREANLRQVIANAADGIVVLGADGVPLFANPAARLVLEAVPAALDGRPFPYALDEGEPRELALPGPGGAPLLVEVRVTSTMWEGSPAQLVFLQDVTERRRHEEERNALLRDLGQRLKELTALHQTARVLQEADPMQPKRMLAQVADLLPDAYQHPEVAQARVAFEDLEETSSGWQAAAVARQRAVFATADGRVGEVEVAYVEARPESEEGPFLREERHLIESIAQMLRAHFDRVQAIDALSRREENFRTLIENVLDVIMTLDARAVLEYGSPAVERVLGYRPDEIEGRSILELVHPHDREPLEALLREAIERPGPPARLELRMAHAAGGWRVLEAAGRGLAEAGRSPRVVVNARDVTERRRRERELEVLTSVAAALRGAAGREDVLERIVDHVGGLYGAVGVAVVAEHPITREVSVARALGALEWAAGMAVEGGLTERALETGEAVVLADADPLIELAEGVPSVGAATAVVPLVAESRMIGALWLCREEPLNDHDLRLLGAVVDISAGALYRAGAMQMLEHRVSERTHELAQANERLQELDRLKSKFVSDVSHELRTPVTNLTLYLTLLERGKVEKREAYIEVLRAQAERLTRLIDDILDLSRLDVAPREPAKQPVDLNAVVRQVVSDLEARAAGAGLRLQLAPEAVPSILVDPSHLGQVITNLVANAINYTLSGDVRVKTGSQGNMAFVSVEDTGLGIAPEDMPHIFERFYRGRQVVQSGTAGTGLGLAIAREIVERHGGTIVVESRAGQGSRFTVLLPTADGADQRQG